MRRKVIKQGAATLTISLPTKWARRFGLRSGDEVEISEGEKGLIISPTGTRLELKGELDISNLSRSMIWRYLNAFYVNGFDEIIVTGCDREKIALLKEANTTLVGFSLVECEGNTCIIKAVSEAKLEEFDDMLRKIFSTLNTISMDTLEAIKRGDLEYLKKARDRDKDLNNAVLFCLRILSKYGYKDQRKTTSMHAFIFFLENIGDLYNDISDICVSTGGKKRARDIKIIEKVNNIVSSLSSVFYEQDKDGLRDMYEANKVLKKEIDDILSRGPSDPLLYTIRRIPEVVGSVVESLMMIFL
ncbi:MAG: AbrB/MazE/SpoVT family DNA-binding domain-containing protein [Candidatus Micrarchaeia archaeon]